MFKRNGASATSLTPHIFFCDVLVTLSNFHVPCKQSIKIGVLFEQVTFEVFVDIAHIGTNDLLRLQLERKMGWKGWVCGRTALNLTKVAGGVNGVRCREYLGMAQRKFTVLFEAWVEVIGVLSSDM